MIFLIRNSHFDLYYLYSSTRAPDWIIEIVSPGTQSRDYGIKLFKYRMSGVREYWIVNPERKMVNVYDFENDEATAVYSFDDTIPVTIYPDLSIKLSKLI